MKKLKWVIGVLLLAVVPVFAIVSVAQAQRFARTVDEGQKVYSSLYSSGKNIEIKGEIFGDVFCAGQQVLVDAIVHGDVICAGQDVTIAGQVDGDIRVAGQNVSVIAAVGRNVTAAASQFSLDADAKVAQDLTATGGLNIKGSVGRDAVLSGDPVILNGKVGRNAAIKSENITLKDKANVAGNLTYTGSTKPQRDKAAVVAGESSQITPRKEGRSYFNPVFYLIILVGFLLIGLFLAACFPKYLERTSGIIKTRPGRTLLVGLVGCIALPAVAFGFALTVVGIPLTLFLLLAFFFAASLTGPIAGYLVGRLVLSKVEKPLPIMLVGGAILVTTYFLPFVGLFFIMAAFWFGLGALLTDLYAHSRAGQRKAS